jgi:hypothetical protein
LLVARREGTGRYLMRRVLCRKAESEALFAVPAGQGAFVGRFEHAEADAWNGWCSW